ncbi:unnamed protein product [Fraxinus pennsylvanica]|uniref:Uncharacterized protein n=1 Tax=Fraxinus pennsylvanica TaxID=56036 RepID=A0AAD1YTC5_9LAMI|nr:unnamed protein product [Fraxinus pennsylvanica]
MYGFSDTGHLEYYNYNNKSSGIIRCGKRETIKEKETKKIKNKLKLLKGLSKDLSTFSNMGFGFNSDEVKGNTTITEAAELLMEQLEKLRAEEKELKKKRKEERKMPNNLQFWGFIHKTKIITRSFFSPASSRYF